MEAGICPCKFGSYVETDRLVLFNLKSKDVLHDFSVPILRLKQDIIPGRVIKGWFKPTVTGDYDLQCAEMCGIGHGIMGAKIHIQNKNADNALTNLKSIKNYETIFKLSSQEINNYLNFKNELLGLI